jgi:RecB family exonuclease
VNRIGVERVFIGWDGPVLARAARAFLERFAQIGPLEIQNILVVVPGARAGRLFLRDIAHGGCGGRPRIVTPGRFAVEVLAVEGEGTPLSLLRVLWREAIGSCGDETIARLGGVIGGTDRERVVDSLARRVQLWHRELMGEGTTLRETAQLMLEDELGFYERIGAAAEVEQAYEALVSRHGVRDLLLERREALQSFDGMRAAPIALVCTPELAGLNRQILNRVHAPVVSFIGAPESHSEGFDPIGCVYPTFWSERETEIPDERIRFEETEQECAAYVLGAVARDAGACDADSVRIGITDPSLDAVLAREAAKQPGIQLRSATGRELTHGRVGVLLNCLKDHIAAASFESYAALVRHPDIEAQINRTLTEDADGWLDDLDIFQAEYLPKHVPIDWTRPGQRTDAQRLARIAQEVSRMTDLLTEPQNAEGDCGAGLISLLSELYAEANAESEDETAQACGAVVEIVAALARYANGFGEQLGAGAYLSMVFEELGRVSCAPGRDEQGVQLLGWLELPWDDAGVCGILGMNDGYVPGAKSKDVLLSDTVRAEFSLGDDRSRLGRDCYLLHVLLHSKKSVTFACARRDRSGAPLVVSRLLLRCDEHTLAARIMRSARAAPEPTGTLRIREPARGKPSGVRAFPEAPILAGEPVRSMSVTSFKTYLRSPYQFLLEHVLGLREREGTLHEIGAMGYGSIVHGVLESFGRNSVKESDDPRAIEEYVLTQLSMIRAARFGKDPIPAVELQLRLLEYRFKDFAAWQAKRTQAGWRIEQVEWSAPSGSAGIEVDGESMVLRGKIDRIDRHESTGRVCIIDYKTGREVKPPGKTHLTAGRWTDLQLPLYRYIARAIIGDADQIELAYVSLPRSAGGVRLLRGDWDEADLQDADQCARGVIRSVREESFADLGDIAKSNYISRTLGALTGTAVTHTDGSSE